MSYFLNNAIYCLKNLSTVNGRARRKEYWYYRLSVLLLIILISFIMGMMIGIGVPGINRDVVQWTASIINLILIFSATVRRLHDTGRSGWWFILYFIPIIGDLVLLIFTVQKGNEGENQFGPDPKQDEVSLINTRDDRAQTDLSV
ncbi:DUF805 domain-containing protein [Escherichia coli]|uniref:DUF805 domain-containing protein n=1 Tax=Escherichia coli TaxID=562 RepID=UPI000246EA06|nr:DUF805 domain-containing protein [Escherichia coli]EHN91608.1 hypothetical protein ESOG_04862 [Escherichia coli E101]MBS9011384.1 DUF805 domain-containing protein [Escherichia coli]HAM4833688.1 DUF805 domain-containing protein [Escherichia coli]HEG1790497.1 DUF805 domain-containing protein [Escherichia coli]